MNETRDLMIGIDLGKILHSFVIMTEKQKNHVRFR